MGGIASIFTHHTLANRGLRAAARSLFKTRVRLGGGEAGDGGSSSDQRRHQQHQQRSVWVEDEEGVMDVEVVVREVVPGAAGREYREGGMHLW